MGGRNEGGNCILGKGEEGTKALGMMELEDGQHEECVYDVYVKIKLIVTTMCAMQPDEKFRQ